MKKMPVHSLAFVLDCNLPFVRGAGASSLLAESRFFLEISYTYLPLLRLCETLERERVPFNISLAIGPVLCEMLANRVLMDRYRRALDALIEFGEREAIRLRNSLQERVQAEAVLRSLRSHRDYFDHCDGALLERINHFFRTGSIELLATTAVNCFLPFYQDMPESISAQIEMGLINYRKHFSSIPRGFYLPELGYAPALERTIKSYGFSYTILETHSFLFGTRVPRRGIFEPAQTSNGLWCLGKDRVATAEVHGATHSFCTQAVYGNTEQDAGFILPEEALYPLFEPHKERMATGYLYQARSGTPYEQEKAQRTCVADARAFVRNRTEIFEKVVHATAPFEAMSVCVFPASLFGVAWAEGMDWLEAVFRTVAESAQMRVSCTAALTCPAVGVSIIEPFFGSSLGGGYADELINSANDWMHPAIQKTTERMIDLTERFAHDTGFRERLLNMAARDVLLCQSLFWPLLGNHCRYPEYAASECADHLKAFTRV